MGRAEIGSTKHLANQMKSKGLQRLRWYCQPCEKQCRDANGFKCHTQSESHVRRIQQVGQDAGKYIDNFSKQFQSDFIQLLRTSHGEKWIGVNRFYNEYIRDKEHVHMNATRFASLTEFTKHLGREGICIVKEDEKDGLMIAWRDTSLAALKRREETMAAETADAKNDAIEDKLMRKMAKRAKEEAEENARILEARKARDQREAQLVKERSGTSGDSASPVEDKAEETSKTDGETPKVEAPAVPKAPVKIGFSLKAKPGQLGKPGLGKAMSKSIFKRARDEGGEVKADKRVKL
ncbi:zinc finger protein-like protein RTS2 [Amniculicola lignicola CBS 123094]|uniref:Zinc finger protein-like protein RTS2 n=1 Tax=Amniculicola lignicola CBS 123094 TaxID=1392246 RepID=A0A6A5W7K1_9PLEO|nr:zinc finger protein-like protein RTS2 [Amniculicola lignicola CBS 123094]